MIIEAARQLAAHGFTLKQEITDPHGIVGVLLQRDNEWYCLVAKEYAYKKKASFIWQVAEFSAKKNIYMMFYQADENSYTVFDALTVEAFGDDSVGKSKKSAAEWREIPLFYGIDLSEHLAGVTPTLPGNQAQLGSF